MQRGVIRRKKIKLYTDPSSQYPRKYSVGGKKNKISAIIYSWTEKLSVARVKVFFAFKHVTAAAMFKPCVRKRDILARFPQLSLDFSTPLHTNNNRTHYIRSTYACVAFVTKHRNTSKRFQEVEKCVGISHAFSFPFPFFFLIPRLYPNDKNKKRERFGRRRIRQNSFRLLIERVNCFYPRDIDRPLESFQPRCNGRPDRFTIYSLLDKRLTGLDTSSHLF